MLMLICFVFISCTYSQGFYDNQLASTALINKPNGVCLDQYNRVLYIVDSSNYRIRAVNLTTNIITTAAGAGGGSAMLDGAAALARMSDAQYCVVRSNATETKVYFSDGSNGKVRITLQKQSKLHYLDVTPNTKIKTCRFVYWT